MLGHAKMILKTKTIPIKDLCWAIKEYNQLLSYKENWEDWRARVDAMINVVIHSIKDVLMRWDSTYVRAQAIWLCSYHIAVVSCCFFIKA